MHGRARDRRLTLTAQLEKHLRPPGRYQSALIFALQSFCLHFSRAHEPSCVGAYDPAFSPTDGTAAELSQLCQADITRLCEDAVKESLLTDSSLCDELFQRLCVDRLSVYNSEDKVG